MPLSSWPGSLAFQCEERPCASRWKAGLGPIVLAIHYVYFLNFLDISWWPCSNVGRSQDTLNPIPPKPGNFIEKAIFWPFELPDEALVMTPPVCDLQQAAASTGILEMDHLHHLAVEGPKEESSRVSKCLEKVLQPALSTCLNPKTLHDNAWKPILDIQ